MNEFNGKIEKSEGIDYFKRGGFIDARILSIKCDGEDLIVELESEEKGKCKILIKLFSKQDVDNFLTDFDNSKKVYWLTSDIVIDGDKRYLDLEVKSYKNSYQNLFYRFNINDIIIDKVEF